MSSPDGRGRPGGVDASLKALGTDYIDLYQVHWPDPKTPFAWTASALTGLVTAGKSRLAVAWRLANPAVQVAIVGTRDPLHVDPAIEAAGLELDTSALRRIDEIVAAAVPVGGSTPESV